MSEQQTEGTTVEEAQQEEAEEKQPNLRKMEYPENFNENLFQQYLNLINHGTLKQNKQLPRDVSFNYDTAVAELKCHAKAKRRNIQRRVK